MHMKKYIAATLLIIILFNALIVTPVFADGLGAFQSSLNGLQWGTAFNQYAQNGTVATGLNEYRKINNENVQTAQRQEAKSAALNNDQDSFIAAGIAGIINLFITIIRLPLDLIALNQTEGDGEIFQIEKLLHGDYPLFNINFFDNHTDSSATANMSQAIKDSVAKWYYGVRTIAIIASLCVLIYIAIRMAISTVTQEKIKYKKMLGNWLASFVILFILHYFIIIMVYVSEMLVSLLTSIQPETGLEVTMYNKLMGNKGLGWDKLGVTIMMLMFTYLQIKFFLIYIKRLVFAGFFIMISPFITVTYAIDKAGDNKAQAFTAWKNEMITLVFIQPLHLLLFMLIFVSAGEIMKASLFIAFLLLWVVSKAESILRTIFKLNGSNSIKTLQDTKMIGKGII